MANAASKITFYEWAKAVDREISQHQKTERNKVTANYAEMYQQGFSVSEAVRAALASEPRS